MKALLLNTLVGIVLGRFTKIWSALAFLPIVAAEVAYGVVVYQLTFDACIRRGITLLIAAEFAFLLGALLRPMQAETPRPQEQRRFETLDRASSKRGPQRSNRTCPNGPFQSAHNGHVRKTTVFRTAGE